MAGVTISGGEKLEKALAELSRGLASGGVLKVGFLEGSTEPNGTSTPLVAFVQEYGSPRKGIPPRPFMRQTIAAHSEEWAPALGVQLKRTNYDVPKSLALLGELVKGEIQETISEGSFTPNSPVTNLLKQRFPTGGQTFADVKQARRDVAAGATAPAGKPLVQSGDMRNAVAYEVSE